MNERLQHLKQRAAASSKSTQATLQRTAPKATLGGIKSVAEKRFGQRKPTKKQQPKQVKQVKQPKKQPKPKSVSSKPLDQWEMAMRKANIPAHRWRKLQDKISRLNGAERTKIEKELFDHEMFKDVYSVGEDDPSIVDEYLSDLEEKLNELTTENISLNELIDNLIEMNPDSALSAALLKDVVTKREVTTALATISNETGVAPDKLLKFGIYDTEDISMQGTSAEPIMDFELSANAIQNRYGIDVRTPEGQEKFEDLVVFEAIGAAEKQNVNIAEDVKKIETLNNMGKDRLNDFEQITGTNINQYLDDFEQITGTNINQYLDNNDDKKLD